MMRQRGAGGRMSRGMISGDVEWAAGDTVCPGCERGQVRQVRKSANHRHEAMDKTLSPDELDRLMRVTSPRVKRSPATVAGPRRGGCLQGVFGTVRSRCLLENVTALEAARSRVVPDLRGSVAEIPGRDRGHQ